MRRVTLTLKQVRCASLTELDLRLRSWQRLTLKSIYHHLKLFRRFHKSVIPVILSQKQPLAETRNDFRGTEIVCRYRKRVLLKCHHQSPPSADASSVEWRWKLQKFHWWQGGCRLHGFFCQILVEELRLYRLKTPWRFLSMAFNYLHPLLG